MARRGGGAGHARDRWVLAACGDDNAGGSGTIAVTDIWARSTPAGVDLGAVYFTLEAERDDALVGVTVDPAVAGGAELHMTMAVGDPSMTAGTDPVAGGSGEVMMHSVVEIALPAGESVALEPGSWHMMLVDLADPLEAGETFELTMRFAHAAEQIVPVEVRTEAP